MSSRERVAALRRARERQSRIEAATTRVARAQQRVERAKTRRQRALESSDSRVAEAEIELAREVEALVTCCGSRGYAAEILELNEREIRKTVSRAQRGSQGTNRKPLRSSSPSTTKATPALEQGRGDSS